MLLLVTSLLAWGRLQVHGRNQKTYAQQPLTHRLWELNIHRRLSVDSSLWTVLQGLAGPCHILFLSPLQNAVPIFMLWKQHPFKIKLVEWEKRIKSPCWKWIQLRKPNPVQYLGLKKNYLWTTMQLTLAPRARGTKIVTNQHKQFARELF